MRQTILDNLDSGYAEGMSYGMIDYFVPHGVFPAGYHCNPRDPLPFAGLASQKNQMAFYLMGLSLLTNTRTTDSLRPGAACADVDLLTIGEAVRRMPAERYIALYEAGRRGRK